MNYYGKDIPEIILNNITRIKVRYFNFDNEIEIGYIDCNKKISSELQEIFYKILELEFPIRHISPISEFNWNDYDSVLANNTSCFNYREVIGSTKISDHATGNAIDINPFQNPWVHPSAHKIEGRIYNPSQKGTITKDVVEIFKSYDWSWGGNWKNPDYQHFFKSDDELKSKIVQYFTIGESIITRYRDFI